MKNQQELSIQELKAQKKEANALRDKLAQLIHLAQLEGGLNRMIRTKEGEDVGVDYDNVGKDIKRYINKKNFDMKWLDNKNFQILFRKLGIDARDDNFDIVLEEYDRIITTIRKKGVQDTIKNLKELSLEYFINLPTENPTEFIRILNRPFWNKVKDLYENHLDVFTLKVVYKYLPEENFIHIVIHMPVAITSFEKFVDEKYEVDLDNRTYNFKFDENGTMDSDDIVELDDVIRTMLLPDLVLEDIGTNLRLSGLDDYTREKYEFLEETLHGNTCDLNIEQDQTEYHDLFLCVQLGILASQGKFDEIEYFNKHGKFLYPVWE